MTRRPLLLLSHRLPYPPHNGAALRTYNVIRLLARDFDVHALCFDRADRATAAMPLADRVGALEPYGTFEVFAIPQAQSRLRFAADHVRSVARAVPYTCYVHDSRPYERRLRALLAERDYHAVHVDSMDLVRFLPLIERLPVVCTHHNVESALLRRRAANKRSAPARAYLSHQANLLERAERHWMPRVALNVAVSDADRDQLQAIAPKARIATVPNGVDTDFFHPDDSMERRGCVFVGGTTWYPNRDALEWYTTEIAPRLAAAGSTAPVAWVGRTSDDEMRRFADHATLQLTGYVDDIRPYVHRAQCFVAPLRVGGGTRLKILDAWAMGAAVVSTSIGCEGLAAVDGENILVADGADKFAAAVSRVLGDDSLRRRLSANARRTAVERYSWDVLGHAMRQLYLNLPPRVGQA